MMEHEINKRLDRIDLQLSEIAKTLQAVAIQGERLTQLQSQVAELWGKVNSIQRTQDRCPVRAHGKLIWGINVPVGLAIILMTLKTFGVV